MGGRGAVVEGAGVCGGESRDRAAHPAGTGQLESRDEAFILVKKHVSVRKFYKVTLLL